MNYKIINGAVTYGATTILESINLEIKENDHIAVVGRNGAGKTTLLNAIYDNELLEEGSSEDKFKVIKIGKFNIGFLKQIEFEDEELTLLDEILKSYKDLIDLEKKINTLSKKMEESNDSKTISDYTIALDNFEYQGGYTYKKEYETMIAKFGFTEEDKYKKIKEFSGGQKTKIAFMRLLTSKPDLMLLDEPTNHLDIDAIEWLEEYLKSYPKAFIVVSHDRMFINNTVNIIYDIEYGETIRYVGNYEKYEELKEERYNKLKKNYEFQQKEIKRLYSIYERFRNKPSKAKMALSKLHQIEKMDILEAPNKIDRNVFKININNIDPSVKKVCEMKDLVFGYDEDKPLGKISLQITKGDKIGIIGSNGTGKSTLLKTIQGIIQPIDGFVSYGLRVTPEYFDQNLKSLNDNNTVISEFMEAHDCLNEEARKYLALFLFKGDDVLNKVGVLSGGEKVRLSLAKIFYDKPNFLILDEPTNHMDMLSRDYLENILSVYEGTLLFVSHDRYFVKKLANKLIVFENGEINFYDFGYDEYLRKIKEVPEIKMPEIKHEKKINKLVEARKQEEEKRVNKYELKKELNKVEQEIIKIENRISNLKNDLYLEENYSDYEKSNSINLKIKENEKELEELNNKWEDITNLLLN
jgi:ATP-binding cassette subfamily F protein 3